MSAGLDKVQLAQEQEYEFPYHYVPMFRKNRFSQVFYWPWGYRYLGGLEIVFEQLENVAFASLVDIGCGDGRFLREVTAAYPDVESVGIDYSERCIQMARAMNPNITYLCHDIIDNVPKRKFDVVTAIEVLEHIHPNRLEAFVKAIAQMVNDEGSLILTVPHRNKPLQPKHYQHFTGADITTIVSPYFDAIDVIPFDPEARIIRIFEKLIGGFGNHFLVTNPAVLSFFFRLYVDRYLYASNERNCKRIAVRCRKK